jgi:RNA polymerase sigma-70 factor (TIGR02960 family)
VAFADLVGPLRGELHLHCYRILGSVTDAEDALQEALTAAWRGLGNFEGRSSLRGWLYRIATNKSLNALRAGRSRPLPAPSRPLPEPTSSGEPLWLDPYPDTLLEATLPDTAPGPAARYESKEAVSLAFVVAVQLLPPMQRAVLVLRDVLGFPAAEVAEMLECTVHAANGLLKRARATMAKSLPADALERAALPDSARQRAVAARFAAAYEGGDLEALVALLTDDAVLSMPPLPQQYQGREAIHHFYDTLPWWREMRLVPTSANGQPAFASYVRDGDAPVAHVHGLIVLTIAGDRISRITRFTDNAPIPWFGLPRILPVDADADAG